MTRLVDLLSAIPTCSGRRARAGPILRNTVLALSLGAASAAAPAAVVIDASRCTVDALAPLAPSNTTVRSTTVVDAIGTVPQYCSVAATVAYPGNAIDFIVGLPTTWNHKLVWTAQGGLAGYTMTLTDAFVAAGYATGITDTGHKADVNYPGGPCCDPAFAYDANKLTDYGHRANKLAVDSAKALVAGYYASAIKRSIFNGCSNGGRSALINAQRYPGQFDGYIVGAPFLSGTGSALDWLHAERAFFRKPSSFMPLPSLRLLGSAVLGACDADDGVVDGVVGNPLACRFDPGSLLCNGLNNPDCLTPDQVDAVRFWNADWKNAVGEVVSRGWPLTGEEGGTPAGLSFFQIGAEPAPVDANGVPYPTVAQNPSFAVMIAVLGDMVNGNHAYDYRALDIESDLGFFAQVNGVLDATDTNLMAAAAKGAKFIFYQGWADPALNPLNLIDYRNAVVARYGDDATNAFMRVFMIPGMTHCLGGTVATDQFDLMPAMERWLDTGAAPDVVLASHVADGVVTRTRPLCAYPGYAHYNAPPEAAAVFGVNDWFYFSCVSP